MYKLLLVDDEPLLRKSLMSTIDYNKIGFSVVGEADNGLKGIEAYKKHKPDVIITDVRMDICDGLKMIEEIRKIDNGACQFIVLSGYNDFEYLKSSISLGVFDYLLKPIKNDELISILSKMKLKLDKNIAAKEAFFKINDKLKILKNEFIRKIFVGNISANEAAKQFEIFDLPSSFSSFYSIYAEFNESSLKLPALENFNYIYCNIENSMYGFVVFNDVNYNFALDLSEQNINSKMGISAIFDDVSQITISAGNSCQAYKNCKADINISFGIHDDDIKISSFVSQAKQFVKENYSKSINTKHIAENFGFSESHFMLLFKKATGTSFSSYLLSYRMEVAIALIKTQRYRIYEICNNVGYRDIKSFRNAFKKYTGLSPVDYKKKIEESSDKKNEKDI